MSRILKFEVPPGKPVLRGQDHYWEVIRELDRKGPWSVTDIFQQSNSAHRSAIWEYVKRLIAGRVAFEDESSPKGTLFRLFQPQPASAPTLRRDGSKGIQGRGQIQMWNVIRGPIAREGFTFKDVAMYGSTEEVQIPAAAAKNYVHHLAQAGYLLCVRKGRPGYPAIWRMKPAMNTGPKPPLVLRTQIVFDQNRGEAVGPIVAREVGP